MLSEYLPVLLVLASAIVGIFGKTYNPETRDITFKGWLTLAIAIASTGIALQRVWAQQQHRDEITKVAYIELHEACQTLCDPFYQLTQPRDATFFPEFLDMLNYASVLENICDKSFVEKLATIKLGQKTGFDGIGRFPVAFGLALATAADRSRNSFDRTVAKYSAYLDAETILRVSAIQQHPFTRRMSEYEKITADRSWDEVPLFVGDDLDKTNYLDLLNLVKQLSASLVTRMDREFYRRYRPNLPEMEERGKGSATPGT